MAGTGRCATGGDEQVDGSFDITHARLANAYDFIWNDLRTIHLEAVAAQKLDERCATGVLALTVKRTVADGDHVRLAHRALVAGRFHVPERPPDFSSSRTDSVETTRSISFVMFISLSPATAAGG